MARQIMGQISIFDLLKPPKVKLPPWLEPKKIVKKVQQCPLNTIIKSPEGWLYIVDRSDYVEIYNDYSLFLRPYFTPETDMGKALYEGKLSEWGYTVIKKGENA